MGKLIKIHITLSKDCLNRILNHILNKYSDSDNNHLDNLAEMDDAEMNNIGKYYIHTSVANYCELYDI